MKKFLLRVAISAFGLWLATQVVPGIWIDGIENLFSGFDRVKLLGDIWGISIEGAGTLAGAALLLGLVNTIVRPVLVVLTLPITILTLGLFLFVVNAATFGLVAFFLSGFHIAGFVPALLGSLLVSIISWILSAFTKD